MQLPVQITFRNMDPSDAVATRIREEAAKLDTFYDRIMGCRVMVETPRHHLRQGKIFSVRVDLTVPGAEIVVRQEPNLHSTAKQTATEKSRKSLEVGGAYKDIYVVIRDAFKSTRRQLQEYARKQSGDVKLHETIPEARITKLPTGEDYGFLQTPTGEEIYFHRNSVLNDAFDQLEVGDVVTFVEVKGDKGPQASTVRLAGKSQRVRQH